MRSSLLRLAALFTLLLSALTALVVLRIPIPGDWDLVQWAVGLRNDALTHFVWMLTFITSATPALVICGAVSTAFARKHLTGLNRKLFASAQPDLSGVVTGVFTIAWPLIAYAGALISNIALRIAVGRMRPGVEYIPHGLPELQADFQRFSYPSGHAGAALVAFVSLAALAWPHKRLRWPAFIFSALVITGTGFGRVYLGVHWPTDVIAGYLLAGAWLATAMRMASNP